MKPILFSLFLCLTFPAFAQYPVIFKLKKEAAADADSIKKIIPAVAERARQKFPAHRPLPLRTTGKSNQQVDLSLIYEINSDSPESSQKIINDLILSGIVQYAELKPLPQLAFIPDDPQISLQYALEKMRVFDAWDITQGDTNIVIGITDTGTDLDHEDLSANIKYNYNDLLNGLDDDGDGYTDNFYGWDLAENDNLPQVQSFNHGAQVSGIAAATTNNSKGMAGTGFKTKYLPVKISNAVGFLTRAYEGIVYAVDHGCRIINCSWGDTQGGKYGQDIINYALDKGALVVAAAGNGLQDVPFYPAAYENVLAVTSVNENDELAQGANYGSFIDLAAPGEFIYTTTGLNSYTYASGTSMAVPHVSAAAALVWAHFPHYTPLQVAGQLKLTSDDIYRFNDPALQGKLGRGRVNIYKALTKMEFPFQLKQNFPNPASGFTYMEFTLPEESAVEITVYDAMGRQVLVPVSNIFEKGDHVVPVDVSSLSQGIYFYSISSGSEAGTGKMVVVK